MEKDNGDRQRFAVGISLTEVQGGKIRLVLDDLELVAGNSEWKKRCFFTFIDVDEGGAREFRLSREAYASIGDIVLARLLALYPTEEPE